MKNCPYCRGTGKFDLSDRLRLLRMKNGETQEEFANNIEISRVQVANLETGRSAPSVQLLMRIVKKYDVSMDWLAGRVK